jgi:hypothetical protein
MLPGWSEKPRTPSFLPLSSSATANGDLSHVAVLVCARARRQVARLAKNANTRHECITRSSDGIRRDSAQKSVLRAIRQRRAVSEPRSMPMACVSVTWVGVTYVSPTGVAHICRRDRMCIDRYSGCRDETCRKKTDPSLQRSAQHKQTPLKATLT